MSARTLLSIHEQRVSEHETGMCPLQHANYVAAVKKYSEFLGHEATTDDLVPASFNAWLESMKGLKTPSTIRARRAQVKTIWTYAFEEGLCDPPRKLRRIVVPPKQPVGLTQADVAKIVQTALAYGDKFPTYPQRIFDFIGDRLKRRTSPINIAAALNHAGYRTFERKEFSETTVERLINEMTQKTKPAGPWARMGIPAGVYLASIISAAWDSGLRRGDLFTFRKSDLIRHDDGSATFEIVMNKTAYMVSGHFGPDTVNLIDACLRNGDLNREEIWPCPCIRRFSLIRNVLFLDAGCEGKTFKQIRSGAASAAELIRFGAGTELLGHRSRQVTVQHYIDPKIVRRDPIVLPSVAPASAGSANS